MSLGYISKKIGIILICNSIVITILLWVLAKPDPSTILTNPYESLSELTGLFAVILFCWDFILATRFHFIEKMFGGIDKVYRIHHILGGLGYAFIVAHPLFDIINVLPAANSASIYYWFSSVGGYNWGILAFYSLTILIIAAFWSKLPYHIWKLTHNFMGIPLALIVLHILFTQSDVTNSILLELWIVLFLFLAIDSFIYTRFLYGILGPTYKYKLHQWEIVGDIIDLYLAPIGKRLFYRPGQFVLITLYSSVFSSEKHPFTISSSSDDEFLRVSIKKGGDFTNKLEEILVPDMDVLVYGPYGSFYENFLGRESDEIWVAGGIGVTPFLSMLSYSVNHFPNRKISFYYCHKDDSDAFALPQIEQLTEGKQHIFFSDFKSTEKGHITAQMIQKDVGDLRRKIIFLCGPGPFMDALQKQCVELGVKHYNIIFEDFNYSR